MVHTALLLASLWLHQTISSHQFSTTKTPKTEKQYTVVLNQPAPAAPTHTKQHNVKKEKKQEKAVTPKEPQQQASPTLAYLGATSPTCNMQLQDLYQNQELAKNLPGNETVQKEIHQSPPKETKTTEKQQEKSKIKTPQTPAQKFEIMTSSHPQAIRISTANNTDTKEANTKLKKEADTHKKQSTFGPHVLFKNKKNALTQTLQDAPPTAALQAAFKDARNKEKVQALTQETDPYEQLKLKHLMDTLINSLQQQIKADVFAHKMPTQQAPNNDTLYYVCIEPDNSVHISTITHPCDSPSWNNYMTNLMSNLTCTNQLGRAHLMTFCINPYHLVQAKKQELTWSLL